jgi:ATP-binding cassette subfamily C (CFTR/MRP) protein 1
MKASIRVRLDSMKYTDRRSKLLQELLGAMRVIKYFCFEVAYSRSIDKLRRCVPFRDLLSGQMLTEPHRS